MKTAFHIHSNFSYDSFSAVDKIIETCYKLGVKRVIITDHDTIHGSIEARKYVKTKNYDLVVPVAAEFLTDAGDIIGFNLSENFKLQSKDVNKVLNQIKKSGGITVLPHPFDNHYLEKINFNLIDFIEVFNSRSLKTIKNHLILQKKITQK